MMRSITLRILQGALALCAFAAPASATTYVGGVLGVNTVFLNFTASPISTGVVGPGSFSDTYQFTYTPLPQLSVGTTTTNNNLQQSGLQIFNISNFRLEWVLEGVGGGTLYDSGPGAGVVTNLILPLAAPNGFGTSYTYDLILSGDANGLAGGVYNYTLVSTAETPLPAALSMFAGGLGVMGLLGWRRRRSAAALAA